MSSVTDDIVGFFGRSDGGGDYLYGGYNIYGVAVNWKKIKDNPPAKGQACWISNPKYVGDISIGVFDEIYKCAEYESPNFNPIGWSGYEWEYDFIPEYWCELEIPKIPEEE